MDVLNTLISPLTQSSVSLISYTA